MAGGSNPAALGSVTAIVPFVNEQQSIRAVVAALLGGTPVVDEVLVIVGERTTAESRAALDALAAEHDGRLAVHDQRMPFLGGALREGIDRCRSTHCLFIYADLEADPALVPELLATARRCPEAVVSASRWLPGSRFEGYGPSKLVLNLAFQKLMAALFLARVTDFTFGYRLYPVELLRSVAWAETGHPFVLESILVPLVLDVPVIEVPTVWRARREGTSSWRPLHYYKYLLTAARVRLAGPARRRRS